MTRWAENFLHPLRWWWIRSWKKQAAEMDKEMEKPLSERLQKLEIREGKEIYVELSGPVQIMELLLEVYKIAPDLVDIDNRAIVGDVFILFAKT